MLLPGLGMFLLVIIGMVLLVRAGIRAGDRPDDARATARATTARHPEGDLPVVLATVRNPSSSPVFVGLSLRRSHLPGWLDGAVTVRVPRWRRRRLGPRRQTVVGIVDSGTNAEWILPAPPIHARWHLVAVLGQKDRRLRVLDRRIDLAENNSLPRQQGTIGDQVHIRSEPSHWTEDL